MLVHSWYGPSRFLLFTTSHVRDGLTSNVTDGLSFALPSHQNQSAEAIEKTQQKCLFAHTIPSTMEAPDLSQEYKKAIFETLDISMNCLILGAELYGESVYWY